MDRVKTGNLIAQLRSENGVSQEELVEEAAGFNARTAENGSGWSRSLNRNSQNRSKSDPCGI